MSDELSFDIPDVEFQEKVRVYPTGPRGPRKRSEAQQKWDNAFKNAMDGKGVLFVRIKPEDADDARKRVAACARLFEKGVTEGEARPGDVKGTVILSWKIRTPVRRPKKD